MDNDFLVSQMQLYNTSIEDVDFSEDVLRCLRWQEYKTIGKLARMGIKKIKKIPGINEEGCREIVEKLGAIGIMIDDQADVVKKRHYDRPCNYPYPNNLISAVKNIDPSQLESETFSRDRLIGISAALSSLTEQEETMIILRYKYSATFEQIGAYYGVTRERARQLVHLGVRKLRHPDRFRLIENGLKNHIEMEAEKRAKDKVANLLHLEYNRGYKDGLSASVGTAEQKQNIMNEKILQTPLSDLDLSVRSFNVLKRAGINTLGDLLAYDTIEAICSIRNMGRKSGEEIARLLSSNGILIDAWASFLKSSYWGEG